MAKAPVTATPHAFYIRPAPGWLDLLFQEIAELVATPLQKYKFEPKITQLKGTVKLHRCDLRQGYEILMRLTTAHDMEWMIMESKCNKWSEVDAILERVPWEDILPNRDVPVHVTTDIYNSFTTASAKLRENFCKIAHVTHVTEGAEFRFKVELTGERLKVFISLAGDPLYKRGYKAKFAATAPLPEHQAAACAKWILAGSKEDTSVKTVFVPFAGSGTLGFEALLVLSQSGPGSFTRKFACDLFPSTPAPTLGFLRRKLTERLKEMASYKILFNEFNEEALSMLKANVAAFPENKTIEILEGDLFKLQPTFPKEGQVLILLNPPYGDRLAKESDVSALYARLGTYMQKIAKHSPKRILGGCLCPDALTWRNFLNELNVPSAETHHFTHGGKEMRLVRWQA